MKIYNKETKLYNNVIKLYNSEINYLKSKVKKLKNNPVLRNENEPTNYTSKRQILNYQKNITQLTVTGWKHL